MGRPRLLRLGARGRSRQLYSARKGATNKIVAAADDDDGDESFEFLVITKNMMTTKAHS